MEKKDKYKLERLVLKTFLKHIKERHLYITFRLAVNHGSRKDMIHTFFNALSPFKYSEKLKRLHDSHHDYASAKSLDDILAIMHKVTPWTNDIGIENAKEIQMVVMNLVNSLLHNCIEYGVRDNMKILQEIGSEIFTECCQELLGDSFEDLTQEETDVPYNLEDIIQKLKYNNVDFQEFTKMLHQQATYYIPNSNYFTDCDNWMNRI